MNQNITNNDEQSLWFRLDSNETIEKLQTTAETGLTGAEAAKRQGSYGLNELVERGATSPWLILWEQLPP